jgi:hypothetical protein
MAGDAFDDLLELHHELLELLVREPDRGLPERDTVTDRVDPVAIEVSVQVAASPATKEAALCETLTTATSGPVAGSLDGGSTVFGCHSLGGGAAILACEIPPGLPVENARGLPELERVSG